MTISKEFKDYILNLDQLDSEKLAKAEETREIIKENKLIVDVDVDGETLIFKIKGED